MSNQHHHDHHHGYDQAHHKRPASFDEVRTMAIESLLIEKGLISAEVVRVKDGAPLGHTRVPVKTMIWRGKRVSQAVREKRRR